MAHFARCAAFLLGIFALGAAAEAVATDPHPQLGYLAEPPSRFLPGKYYFEKASFYLKNDKTPAAVDMLKVAGSWGHKIAQYNLGVIYFNGLGGIKADRPLGVAWFGIAAQNHGSLADRTLLEAWKSISPDERKEASALMDHLLPDYADDVTQRRARARFVADLHGITGSHLGHPVGPITEIAVGSGDGVPGDAVHLVQERQRDLDQMLGGTTGRVEVGGVQTIDIHGRPLPVQPPKDSGKDGE